MNGKSIEITFGWFTKNCWTNLNTRLPARFSKRNSTPCGREAEEDKKGQDLPLEKVHSFYCLQNFHHRRKCFSTSNVVGSKRSDHYWSVRLKFYWLYLWNSQMFSKWISLIDLINHICNRSCGIVTNIHIGQFFFLSQTREEIAWFLGAEHYINLINCLGGQ